MLSHEPADLIDLSHRYDQVEIETDQRLYISVDSLAANHAKADSIVLEQGEDFVQKIGFVQSDAFQNESAFIKTVISTQ
jgi:hypothetical protein